MTQPKASSCILKNLIAGTTRSGPANRHADSCINFDQWQWHQGVALYGLLKAHAALGDSDSFSFVLNWVKSKLEAGDRPKSINTTAPVLAMAELYELFPKPILMEVCNDYAEWCLRHAPRLPDGTFEHSCTENRYPSQVWADTLFMGCIFLAKWGVRTGKADYINEACRQFANHYQYLADEKTGLIFHGYDGLTGSQKGVLWGRGNGWFTVASVEVLRLLPEQNARNGLLLKNFRRHLEGVLATQHASGAWHTVMNESATYLEMSATAAFAAGLHWAGTQPWGDDRHRLAADRAYAILEKNISENGELIAASGGTPVLPSAKEYNAIPFAVTGFAQGLALLALSLKCTVKPSLKQCLREKASCRHALAATAADVGMGEKTPKICAHRS